MVRNASPPHLPSLLAPKPATQPAPRPTPRLPTLTPTCMRSLKVSVPVTARTTPNTARSARSGLSPPMKRRPPIADTHSFADCWQGG